MRVGYIDGLEARSWVRDGLVVMFIIVLILTASVGLAGALFVARYVDSHRIHNQLLTDLGLQKSGAGRAVVPFYKWSWRRPGGERVCAERIVRKAFAQAKIWLAPGDLSYFKQKCKDYDAGVPIREDGILKCVERILHRSKLMTDTVEKRVRETLQRIVSTTEGEAEKILQDLGIQFEKENALLRYGTRELRSNLAQTGSLILGADSQGFRLEDHAHDAVYFVYGLDGWERWLKAYKDAIIRQCSRRIHSPADSLLRSLRAQAMGGLFRECEEDVQQSRRFRAILKKEIEGKKIELAFEEIDKIEQAFYSWRFAEGAHFTYAHHKVIRDLLIRGDLNRRFREIVAQALTPNIQSARALVDRFPRKVIFYGQNADVRAYAAETYGFYMDQLFLAFAPPVGLEILPPVHVAVSENDLRSGSQKEHPPGVLQFVPKKINAAKAENAPEPNIADRLEKQKRVTILQHGQSMEAAEKRGWIINLGTADLHQPEFAALEEEPYKSYLHFPCDVYGNMDINGVTYQAKKQRNYFFSMVLDALIFTPAIHPDTPSLEPRSIATAAVA